MEKLIQENDTLKNELNDQYHFNIVEKDGDNVQNKEHLIANLKFQIDQLIKTEETKYYSSLLCRLAYIFLTEYELYKKSQGLLV